MEIRIYRESDQASVIALWNEVFPNPAPRNDPARSIERKLLANDGLFFVADAESQIVGTVMGGYDGHRGWVYSLAVASGERRQGIGAKLMRHLEEELKQRGCCKVNLQVLPDNSEVTSFYQELGFNVEERISMGKII
jgi:ribosomal protein S18 acetylase RimI-like enzyme